MWQRFTVADLRIITHYIGKLLLFLTAAELVPLVVALGMQEWHAAARYCLSAGFALTIGSLLCMVLPSPGKLSSKNALAITGLAWIILTFFSALPLSLSGHFGSYLDAVFEAMSAWTTTGASLAVDLDHMAFADNMWRIFMQCMGGLGVVVIALSLGMFGRSVDSSLYSSEGRSEHVVPNILTTSRFIVKFALVINIVAGTILFGLCVLIGMEPVRAFFNGMWLSMASFATGGMTSMSPGMIYYHSGLIEVVVMTVILFGAINFTLHSEVWRGRIEHFFNDIEIRTLVVWLSIVVLVFVANLCAAHVYDDLPVVLRRSVFTVVSAFSSTGFQTISTNQLATVIPSGGLLILAFCMAVGGSSGSTAGGIKAFRIGIMLKELSAYFKDVLAPDSARQMVTYYHVGRRPLEGSIVRANMAVIFLYGVVLLAAVIITVAYGYGASLSIFECVSMTSNIGMSAGIITPGMPDVLKVVYIVCMWTGRLEFVAIFALIIALVSSMRPRRVKALTFSKVRDSISSFKAK